MEDEKYSLEEAQVEAEVVQKKVESGKAPSYTEADKQLEAERRLHLSQAKGCLEWGLKSIAQKEFSVSELNNAGFYLREILPDLARRLYQEAIPKLGIVAAQEAMNRLGGENELNEEKLNECYQLIGHKVRKSADIPRNFFQDSSFDLALSKFIADSYLLNGELARAAFLYEILGEMDKLEEISRIRIAHNDPNLAFIKRSTDFAEIALSLRKSYDEFVEAIKNTPEYSVDLEKVLQEIMQAVDDELARSS